MVEFDFLSVIYADGVDQMVWIRNVNQNLPEDRKVINLFDERTTLDDYIRNFYAAKINSLNNLIY